MCKWNTTDGICRCISVVVFSGWRRSTIVCFVAVVIVCNCWRHEKETVHLLGNSSCEGNAAAGRLLCRWPRSGNRMLINAPNRPLNSKEHSSSTLEPPSASTSPYTQNGCRRIRHPTRRRPRRTSPTTHCKRPRAVGDVAVPHPTGEAEIPSPGNTGKRMDRRRRRRRRWRWAAVVHLHRSIRAERQLNQDQGCRRRWWMELACRVRRIWSCGCC